MRRGLLFVVSALLILSCNNIENKIRQMQSRPIKLCVDDMQCMVPNQLFDSVSYCNEIAESSYKLIVYIDSLECMSCMIGKMHSWDSFISEMKKSEKDLCVIFIFSPKKEEIINVTVSLMMEKLNFPVFIDAQKSFSIENAHIPNELYLHTFLIDKNYSVLLVGDPRRNVKIQELLNSIIG